MKKFLFYFALMCWLLGIYVHVLAITGVDVAEKFPFVWLLHIVIFAVWIPVIFDLRNNEELKAYQQSGPVNRMNPIGFAKIVFKETPTWLIIIAIGGFFYTFINFALFANSLPGIKDVQHIPPTFDNPAKTLTEQEYHHLNANHLRGFSGHWIAFYGIAVALLYKYNGIVKQEKAT